MTALARNDNRPRVVVLGGGNGTSRLLAALKPLLLDEQIASLHALVVNADDGGSTGRLREQYDVSAMGDLTRCLVALSGFHGDIRGEEFLKALDHRFDGGDFSVHTLRNIFLTSLEQTSDIDAGLAMMARLLQIPKFSGVVPTTLRPLRQQVVVTVDGQTQLIGEGQHFISHNVNLQADPRWQPGDVQVQFAEGDVPLNPRAQEILDYASHIVIAPGHTYGTILPLLALPALQRALQNHTAQLIGVMPLLTTPRQTTEWSGEDFARVYAEYCGRKFDAVISNTGESNLELVDGQAWVHFLDSEHDYELINEDVVSMEEQVMPTSDVVPRAIAIHDAEKLSVVLRPLLVS